MAHATVHRVLSLLLVVALGGCIADIRPELSGKMGCPPEDIVVHDGDGAQFTAECRGELFYCSRDTYGVSCSADRSAASPAPAMAETRTAPEASRIAVSGSRPPIGAGGFSFGADAAAAAKRCTDAGQLWDANEGDRSLCSGTPASIGMDASTRLRFCDGELCSITLLVRLAEGEPVAWVHRYVTLQDTLAVRYGAPAEKDEHIGSDCAAEMGPCLESGKISLSSWWRWSDGTAIRLTLGRIEGAPSTVAIGIVYSDPTLAKGSPRADGL